MKAARETLKPSLAVKSDLIWNNEVQLSMAAVCQRPSCRKAFDPDQLVDNACQFHPGAPVFHEGLKSYSCCSSVNKPVLTFDEFERIPGCATGTHTLEAPTAVASSATVDKAAASLSKASINGSTPKPAVQRIEIPPRPARRVATPSNDIVTLQDDPPDAVPAAGASCKRSACKAAFADGMERSDDECIHHTGTPVFHEGSKGWACCKRRVLDFSDFLSIEGCQRGRHVFVGAPEPTTIAPPRTDHYQTPTAVIASIFLKNVDAGPSNVHFTHWTMEYELVTKSGTRAAHIVDLFGPIDPDKSSHRVLGTKVEITMTKADGRSWPALEAAEEGASTRGSTFTFGVPGRVGTVGGKEAHFQPNGTVL